MAFHPKFLVEELALRQVQTTIGCDGGCDITIDDSLVSRMHAVFVLQGDGVEIRDLGSRTGLS